MIDDPIEKFVKEHPKTAIDMIKKHGSFCDKLFANIFSRCMNGKSKFSIGFRKGFENWQKNKLDKK